LALAGCAATDPTASPPEPTTDTHGEIAGAAELAEPALGLTSIDAEGHVSHLDLLDESTADLGAVRAPRAVHSDGRYLFAADETGVSIVDSGVWTWDHVDHFHYYRAQARVLGDVDGGGVATVATSNSSTTGGTGVFFPDSGDAVLLDTDALSKGRIEESFRLSGEPGAGLVVPVGSFAAVAAGDVVTLHTADGAPTDDSAPCIDPVGTITTRVGAVIGCQDAALLVHVEDERPVVERIPYPAGATAPRAVAFANREGRPRVAALAGDAGVWVLDTRARAWTLLAAPEPIVQVTAVDDADANLLALTRARARRRDGRPARGIPPARRGEPRRGCERDARGQSPARLPQRPHRGAPLGDRLRRRRAHRPRVRARAHADVLRRDGTLR
jgi:hypothetical protein